MSFEEALDVGLIHSIYEKPNYIGQVLEYARQFVPQACQIGKLKQAIYHGAECSLGIADILEVENEASRRTVFRENGVGFRE